MDIGKLKNTVQTYDWGSTSMIPNLLGNDNPADTPMAELWMGAHPKAPSTVLTEAGEIRLDELIRQNPESVLGKATVDRFGPCLPFLFKVLAAGKPLSIQSHPNKEQARVGFERENTLGLQLDAPNRNYRDDNHKPEIICALTPFWAMCGFRDVAEIVDGLTELQVPELSPATKALLKKPGTEGLRELFGFLLNLDDARKASVTASVVEACANLKGDAHSWVVRLHHQFPDDVGILCPLLLNLYHLSPGEALYLDAGELHAYLDGLGIELMANSDNVLRGGLTAKHMDVPELLSTLTFAAGPKTILSGEKISEAETLYKTPAAEFVLSSIRILPESPYVSGRPRSAEIYISVEGECEFVAAGADHPCALGKGESVLVPGACQAYTIQGDAFLYKATVPTV